MFLVTQVVVYGSVESNFRAEIQKSGLANQVSIFVADPQTGKPLFAHRSKELMNPASLTKLLTTGAVLSQFAPGHKFKTELLVSGEDLYLRGGGDPGFVSESMWFLVNEFLRSEISLIKGDIIVDDSRFDEERFDPSRQKERVHRAYDAPVGAMSFNWNSVNVFVRPGEKSGDKARVFIDPKSDYIEGLFSVKTTASGGANVEVERSELKSGKNKLEVKGTIGLTAPEKVVYVSVTEPALWSGENLKQFLEQRGVTVRGQIKKGKTPARARVVAKADSKSIELLVADMNKFSNNFVAEMLTKNLSSEFSQSTLPADLRSGVKRIQNWMESLGLKNEKDFSIENPSGLTRNNRITAEALWKVLSVMKNDFSSQPEIFSSLPISGVDGTLKNRMKNGARGVRAKTGLLNGVVGLAGYSGNETQVIPFVMIFNGNADEAKVRNLFDRLALSLTQM